MNINKLNNNYIDYSYTTKSFWVKIGLNGDKVFQVLFALLLNLNITI